MSKPPTAHKASPPDQWLAGLSRLRRYNVLLFIIFVVVLYAILFLRIGTLLSTQPSSDAVDSQVQAAHIRIDPSVVRQLQSLQNNNVNVQSLFNQARDNPFQQ